MNYLAHLYLSGPIAPLMLGNLLGDFVRGPVGELGLPAELADGVRLHRRIDAYTDRHPVFRRSRARISPERSRYGAVIVDMAYDHYLACNWRRFSDLPLEEFSGQVCDLARDHAKWLPDRLRAFIAALETHRVFEAYATRAGIDTAFRRMAQRARPGNPLAGAIEEIDRAGPAIEKDFLAFLPAISEAVREWR